MKKFFILIALLLTVLPMVSFSQEAMKTSTTTTNTSVTPGYRLVKRVTIVPKDGSVNSYVVLLLDHDQVVKIQQRKSTYRLTQDEAFVLRPGDEVKIRREGDTYVLIDIKFNENV